MRVLMPQRFDVLSRSMDTSIVSQWLGLQDACDLVLWGPALDGFVPGMPLDEVAEHVDADVVLLPDLHHAIPGLWADLWEGAERCRRPVVYNLGDFGSEVSKRRAMWERIRPTALLLQYSPSVLSPFGYDDLFERLGTSALVVPMGFDAVQFCAPPAGAERDIDLLLAGCEDPAIYPVRTAVRAAAARLADEFTIVDISHPGYWETFGIQGRGQAHYADLLRRTRLALTGTGFSALMRKYWEVAGCGAIGVGDLPAGEPDGERFTDAMLQIDPAWGEERIADEIRTLLSDRRRCDELSRQATRAAKGCDHRDRGALYAQALATVARKGARAHRPRPAPPAASALQVCAAPDPAAVPSVRSDWVDIWSLGAPGASRTRRTELAMAGDQDVVILAFDPDAALEADALVLATACRRSGQVVVRPGQQRGGDLLTTEWSAIAAPRDALRGALGAERGRAGVEAAVIGLGGQIGWEILDGPAYADPASALMRLSLDASSPGMEHALSQALNQRRPTTASELAGVYTAARPGAPTLVAGVHPDSARPPQDPECDLLDGGAFMRFDPRDPGDQAAVVRYAQQGPQAPPLHIGVPLSAGVSVTDAFSLLAAALEQAGVDLDRGPDLAVLERPLFEAELAWLTAELRAPALITDTRAPAAV